MFPCLGCQKRVCDHEDGFTPLATNCNLRDFSWRILSKGLPPLLHLPPLQSGLSTDEFQFADGDLPGGFVVSLWWV